MGEILPASTKVGQNRVRLKAVFLHSKPAVILEMALNDL
jgi:hypothetical protein